MSTDNTNVSVDLNFNMKEDKQTTEDIYQKAKLEFINNINSNIT